MLIEFKVKNYRSIKEQQVFSMVKSAASELEATNTFSTPEKKRPLQLLRSATIYGANSAGKSNLLKAIRSMQIIVLNSSSDMKRGSKLPVMPFILDHVSKDEPTQFEAIFISKEVKYQYGFSLDSERIYDEWLYAFPEGTAQTWFERSYNHEKNDHEWYFGSKLAGNKKIWSESTRDNALFLSTAIQLNSEQLQPVYDWFANFLHILERKESLDPAFTLSLYENPKYREKIDNFLSIADFDIESLKVTEEKFDLTVLPDEMPETLKKSFVDNFKDEKVLEVRSLHKSLQGEDIYLNFSNDESDGTNKFLTFIGPWIDTLENGFILVIDELHDNFHPLMVRFLIELFHSNETNPKNAQLIFTSHETSVMSQEIFRRDQIWFCEKKNKSSQIFSLVEFKPRKGVTDIEKSYFSGRYGALPYFKSISRAMGVHYVEEE